MVKRSPIGTMPIFGSMQLVDQRHVGEDVGVAHVIERLVIPGNAGPGRRIAEIGIGPAVALKDEECSA